MVPLGVSWSVWVALRAAARFEPLPKWGQLRVDQVLGVVFRIFLHHRRPTRPLEASGGLASPGCLRCSPRCSTPDVPGIRSLVGFYRRVSPGRGSFCGGLRQCSGSPYILSWCWPAGRLAAGQVGSTASQSSPCSSSVRRLVSGLSPARPALGLGMFTSKKSRSDHGRPVWVRLP